MKYTVYREGFFSAAHHLRNYHGKCENVHGHNWRVRVAVTANELDSDGFVVDFKVLDKVINTILDNLDHKDINNVPPFDVQNPTAEQIAQYLFIESDREIKAHKNTLFVSQVSVWESEKSCAIIQL